MQFRTDDVICHTAKETKHLLSQQFTDRVISKAADANLETKCHVLTHRDIFIIILLSLICIPTNHKQMLS